MGTHDTLSRPTRFLSYAAGCLLLAILIWLISLGSPDLNFRKEPVEKAQTFHVNPGGKFISPKTEPRIGPEDIRVAESSASRVIVTHVTSEHVNNFAIDGQFRYTFNVHNHGPKPFRGEVAIDVARSVTAARHADFGGDTFTIEKAIQPGEATDVYLDRYMAPAAAHIHGEYGIRVFKWVVSVDGQVVNSGVDSLNDKYENLVSE